MRAIVFSTLLYFSIGVSTSIQAQQLGLKPDGSNGGKLNRIAPVELMEYKGCIKSETSKAKAAMHSNSKKPEKKRKTQEVISSCLSELEALYGVVPEDIRAIISSEVEIQVQKQLANAAPSNKKPPQLNKFISCIKSQTKSEKSINSKEDRNTLTVISRCVADFEELREVLPEDIMDIVLAEAEIQVEKELAKD